MLKAAFTLVLTVCFLGCSLFAQQHDNVWLFGYNAASPDTLFGGSVIDFSEEPPLVYQKDRQMNIDVTMASACDSSGVLQFYTNGISINDTTDQLMVNGDNLNPGEYADSWSWAGYFLVMSEIAIPLPGQPLKYALFHLKIENHPVYVLAETTLYMTMVDMGLNGGLGAVVSKNVPILTDGNFGTVHAVKHANGRDWWISVINSMDNTCHTFLFDTNGLSGPFVSDLQPGPCCLPGMNQLIFSPDGTKAALYNNTHGLTFLDFDRCSGTFSNPVFKSLPDSDLGSGIAFSQDSRFFYLAYDAETIYQYDLWSDNVFGSQTTVAKYDGFHGYYGTRSSFLMMQLGPDGRIYISSPNTIEVLSYIDRPNQPGLDCRVVQHGLHLPTMSSFTCPHYPYYRLGPLDGSPCDTLGLDNHPVAKFRYDQDTTDYLTVEFADLSYYEPTEWYWDFGDPNGASGNTSSEPSPVHTFPSDGTYEVCLTVSNQYDSSSYCRTLVIGTGVSASGEEVPAAGLSVFPNPAREATNFILSDYLPQHAVLYLHTATGQVVLTQRIGFGWNSVPLEGVAPGLYFYEVRDNGKLLGSGKLVVAR